MGLFSSPTPYKGQVYNDLKKNSQETGHLFIDLEFPPDDKSLFYSKGKMAGVEWKRPKDICENPKLFVEGTSSGDVTQGRLGNCWFVAASSCLAQVKEIWQKVIPDHKDQEWNEEKPDDYRGIFHFNFWRYGEWIDVVIDDFLPTSNGQLIFVHSQSKNEFWSALLEKAYAKLFGCYEALDGGSLEEALVDFTGGVAEAISMVEHDYANDETKRLTLWASLSKEMERRSLMAAAIPASSAQEMEMKTDTGLVKGHAYGITSVKKIPLAGTGLFGLFNKEKIKMVRLRNPWGEHEWNGAFSDGSPEWEKISKSDREKLGLTFEDDGEFWMTFEDFCKFFTNLAICRVVNTSFFSIRRTWHEGIFHGEWKNPMRAGGCLNNRDTFLKNPQYVFRISEKEEDMMMSLMQKKGREGGDNNKMTIGFSIMKVEENRAYRVHQLQEMVQSSAFRNSRSLFLRHTLKKGCYVVIPCTFEPGHEGQYLFRMYSGGSDVGFSELKYDHPVQGWFTPCFCWTPPSMVTRITVVRAVGLEKQDTTGGADPYVIISCEGEKVSSHVVEDSLNPQWETKAIFYRKKPVQKPVKVEIWNSNAIRDQHMGTAIFIATEPSENKVMEVDLQGRKGQVKMPGKLFVEITTSTDIDAL